MRPLALALLVLLSAGLLSACGKKGAPRAPGPASEITYPKPYPSR